MKKISVTKILIIISLIIIIFGILIGIEFSNVIENNLITNESINIDGSDFQNLLEISGTIFFKIIGMLIMLSGFVIDIIIWLLYGIIMLIIKIVKKIINRK